MKPHIAKGARDTLERFADFDPATLGFNSSFLSAIQTRKFPQVNITDTGGDIELSDVGPSSVVDQSGALLLKNVSGDLDVSDEAGDARAFLRHLRRRARSGDPPVLRYV